MAESAQRVMRRQFFISLLMLAGLASCRHARDVRSFGPPQPLDEHVTTRSLEFWSADYNAVEAAAKGRCKLYAYQSYNWVVPGSSVEFAYARKKYGVIFIDDATHYSNNNRQKKINGIARNYASVYNEIVSSACYKTEAAGKVSAEGAAKAVYEQEIDGGIAPSTLR